MVSMKNKETSKSLCTKRETGRMEIRVMSSNTNREDWSRLRPSLKSLSTMYTRRENGASCKIYWEKVTVKATKPAWPFSINIFRLFCFLSFVNDHIPLGSFHHVIPTSTHLLLSTLDLSPFLPHIQWTFWWIMQFHIKKS